MVKSAIVWVTRETFIKGPNEIWDDFIYSHISERIERIPHDRDPQRGQRGGDQPVGDRPERRG